MWLFYFLLLDYQVFKNLLKLLNFLDNNYYLFFYFQYLIDFLNKLPHINNSPYFHHQRKRMIFKKKLVLFQSLNKAKKIKINRHILILVRRNMDLAEGREVLILLVL